jgi:hypothetical protein
MVISLLLSLFINAVINNLRAIFSFVARHVRRTITIPTWFLLSARLNDSTFWYGLGPARSGHGNMSSHQQSYLLILAVER